MTPKGKLLSKPITHLTVLFLIFMLFTIGAYGVYWIFSNQVTVTVASHILTLTPESQTVVRYKNATFTAKLEFDNGTTRIPVQGVTINLIRISDNSVVYSNITGADGTCKLYYNVTEPENTTIAFKAGAQLP